MGQRIGREGTDGDEPQVDLAAEMHERDAVVAGQRRIGQQRRETGKNPVVMRGRRKAFLQILQRKATQFLVEKPATNGYRCPADDGPKVSFQGHPVLPIFPPPRYVDCCGPAGESTTLGAKHCWINLSGRFLWLTRNRVG